MRKIYFDFYEQFDHVHFIKLNKLCTYKGNSNLEALYGLSTNKQTKIANKIVSKVDLIVKNNQSTKYEIDNDIIWQNISNELYDKSLKDIISKQIKKIYNKEELVKFSILTDIQLNFYSEIIQLQKTINSNFGKLIQLKKKSKL